MVEEQRYLLGIDLGTTGVKSMLLDADGAVAGSATAPLGLSIPRPGWSEQDPTEWWTATGASVRDVMARTGIRPETIAGVGISGQMHGAVLLDATGEVVRPCILWNDVAGRVTAEAAATCGLAAGTVVVAGGADNACAAVGTGVIAPGRLMGSIGTSGTMVAPTATPEVDPGGRAHTFCHAVPDTWYVMGVMLSAGGALRWFRDVWCQAEAEQAAREGRDAYDVLMELAAAVPAGAEGLLCLPYLSGERTPHGDPHARGVFCGLTLHHGKGHLIRAVVEGVTFGLRDSLEIIRALGLPAGEVYATGGGARSPLWRQILADVFSVPVVAELAGEGPALGAALLAGAGTDVFSLQDGAARAVRTGAVVRPQPDHTDVYERAYAAYTRLYPALSDLFPLLEAMS